MAVGICQGRPGSRARRRAVPLAAVGSRDPYATPAPDPVPDPASATPSGAVLSTTSQESSESKPSLGAALSAKLGTETGLAVRYLATSGLNVVNHQVLLQMAIRWWGWSGGAANVFAAMVAVIPAYLLSRYWVWQVQGRPSLRDEVIPFWIIAAIGLIASTTMAELADRIFGSAVMISVGSLIGYLLVWVAKFFVLNLLFKRSADRHTEVPAG